MPEGEAMAGVSRLSSWQGLTVIDAAVSGVLGVADDGDVLRTYECGALGKARGYLIHAARVSDLHERIPRDWICVATSATGAKPCGATYLPSWTSFELIISTGSPHQPDGTRELAVLSTPP
jgi:hypothetical protein